MANQRLRSVPCDLQVLHSHMKKEIESSRSTLTAYDLMRTRGMRRISICLIVVWSEDTPSSPSLHQWSFTCIRALLHTTATTTAQQKQRRVFRTHCRNTVQMTRCLCAHLSTCHQQSSVSFCRFSTSFAYYGLAMDLQKFGVSHRVAHNTTCFTSKHIYLSIY